MQEELDEIMRLLDAATPGEWHAPHLSRDDGDCSCNCGYVFSERQRGMGAICEVFSDLKGGDEEEPLLAAKANGELIAAAVNFLRKYGRDVQKVFG